VACFVPGGAPRHVGAKSIMDNQQHHSRGLLVADSAFSKRHWSRILTI
jgi:hypothetical protein